MAKLMLSVLLLAMPALGEGATVLHDDNPPPTFAWAAPTKLETAAFLVADALIWVDVLQSVSAPKDWVEYNPLLGEHPSNTKLVLLGGVAPSLLLGALWYALPSGWRYAVPFGIAAVECPIVIRNHEAGLRIRF